MTSRIISCVVFFFSIQLSLAQFIIDSDGDTINFDNVAEADFTPGSGDDLDSDWWSVDVDGDGVIESGLRIGSSSDLDEVDFGGSGTDDRVYGSSTILNEFYYGSKGFNIADHDAAGDILLAIRPHYDNTSNNDAIDPALTLKVQNTTDSTLSELTISYDLFHNNRSTTETIIHSFSHSADNSSFSSEASLDYTSAGEVVGWTLVGNRSITISGLNIQNNGLYYLKWNFSGAGTGQYAFGIDNIVIKGTTVSTGSTSTLSSGATTEPTTISSLTTYNIGAPSGQENAVINFDFNILDDGSSPAEDDFDTRISKITINQGAGNDVTDWIQAIDSAILVVDSEDSVYASSINSTTLEFEGFANSVSGDLGFIADNGSKTFQLKIILKDTLDGDLPTTIEGMNFVFEVDDESIELLGESSSLISNQSVNSGTSNNEVEVLATTLSFHNLPNSVGSGVTFALEVRASDANGNADIDSTTAITLEKGAGSLSATLTSASGLTKSLVSGVLQWTDLIYDTPEIFDINASGTGFSGSNSGSILAAEAYRTALLGTTGSWTSVSSWEYNDGTGWVTATAYPDQDDGPITIVSGDTISIESASAISLTIDQITIQDSAQLNYTDSDVTLVLADASGEDDLIIENGGTLQIDEYFDITGSILVSSGAVITTNTAGLEDTLAGVYSSKVTYEDSATFLYQAATLFGADTYFPNVSTDVIPIFKVNNLSGWQDITAFNCTFNGIYHYATEGVEMAFRNAHTIDFRNGIYTDDRLILQELGSFSISGEEVYFMGSGYLDLNGGSLSLPANSSVSLQSDFDVANGDLNLASGTYFRTFEYELSDTQDANVNISSGATLDTEHSSGVSGTFNIGGTLSFSVGANLVYSAVSAQNSGLSTHAISAIGDLTINNNGLILDNPITISGRLQLTDGVLTSTAVNFPTMEGSSSTSGGSDSSYIDGKVGVVDLSSSYEFPIGNGGDYRPITLLPLTSSDIVMEHVTGTPSNNEDLGIDLDTILQTRYWTFNRSSGSGDVIVTLDVADEGFSGNNTLRLAKLIDGTTEWASEDSLESYTNTTISDTLESIVNGTEIDLTLGADDNNGFVLPITLVSFEGFGLENVNQLSWVTLDETDFSHFELMRSINGSDFKNIGRIGSRGGNQKNIYYYDDDKLLDNTYYYRLKLVDLDGIIVYSKTIKIDGSKQTSIDVVLSPNPVRLGKDLKLNLGNSSVSAVTIHDMTGNTMFNSYGLYNSTFILPSTLESGLYTVFVQIGDKVTIKKLVVNK